MQRVAQASVTGGGATASIGRGLCVLVGFEAGDTTAERDALLNGLLRLRLFKGEEEADARNWTKNVLDLNGDILLVSQFTLSAVLKSGKPSFHRAMPPEPARSMWAGLVERCRELHAHGAVESCVFGSMMDVQVVNEGPVTICLSAKDGKCTTW